MPTQDSFLKSFRRILLLLFGFTIVYNVFMYQKHNYSFVSLSNKKTPVGNDPHFAGSFLHVTDMHYDKYYKAGSDHKEFCHRSTSKNGKKIVGKFGAFETRCDSPIKLVEATFEFIKKLDVDFVVDTGDFMRHDRDDKLKTTNKEVIESFETMFHYYNKTLDLKKTKVFPTIGNNDVQEHNSLKKNDKMYKQLKKIWGKHYGLDLKEEFLVGGYYFHDLNHLKLRIISLNTMYFFDKATKKTKGCSKKSKVGYTQLKWLDSVLLDSKINGLKNMIIGHVPPLSKNIDEIDYTRSCYSKYTEITGKYSNIINGHFYGHNNIDSVSLLTKNDKNLYSIMKINKDINLNNKEEIVGAIMVAPSILPANENSGLRVYSYQTKTKENCFLQKMIQFNSNIKAANKKGTLNFTISFDTNKDYNMNSLCGNEWEKYKQKYK